MNAKINVHKGACNHITWYMQSHQESIICLVDEQWDSNESETLNEKHISSFCRPNISKKEI